ncbi:regulatory protein RecX [Candidatus Soleaferrea massiliensis]|uniref:regulatory protein RecX n=1 Tax=Candidatus Soleaferrea massiliensis TaxID=1470354 RepID=UPI0005903F8F|nr:regulatory protein RecX [Candidatus Soleaferrea massiliensis]
MRITAVRQKKGVWYDVFVEDEYFVTASYETIFLHKVKPGAEMAAEELAEFQYQVNYHAVKEKALSLLSFKAYTRRKLCDKLYQSLNKKTDEFEEERYSRELIEEVAGKLCETGLIDDEDYARRYAKDLRHFKSFGKQRIRLELQKLGIPKAVIEAALDELEIDEEAEIRRILEKKYLPYLDDPKGIQKTIAALHRLGYSACQVKAVIAELGA